MTTADNPKCFTVLAAVKIFHGHTLADGDSVVLTDQQKRTACRLKGHVLKGGIICQCKTVAVDLVDSLVRLAVVYIAIHAGDGDGLCGVCARKIANLRKFAADNNRAVLVGIKQTVRRVDGRGRRLRGQTVRRIGAASAQVHNGFRACRRGAECKCQQHQKCRDKRNAEFAEMFFHCVQSPFIDARASYVLFIISLLYRVTIRFAPCQADRENNKQKQSKQKQKQ